MRSDWLGALLRCVASLGREGCGTRHDTVCSHITVSLGERKRSGEERGEQQVPDMAKEGAEMTEETECMINRNAGKDAESAESSSDAKEMRAVILTGFGGLNKLRLGKKAMPELRDGEVKIRVKAW